MVRSSLALLCTSLLVWSSLAYASAADQALPGQSLKERITQIPSGSVVQVKLANKQNIRGRLGSITNDGFDLQYARSGKIVTETLMFDNVQSVRMVGQGWSIAKKIVVGTLIGAGVLLIIGIVSCAAGGCSG